jgi:hypothetical protein
MSETGGKGVQAYRWIVLADPTHAEFHAVLSACPQADLAAVADLLPAMEP